MKSFTKRCLQLVLLTMLVFNTSIAQEGGDASGNELLQKTVWDLSVVSLCGLGGALLGLSTLSFVDHPSDHYRRILVGGALGVIIGVGIVAFSQAKNSQQLYQDQEEARMLRFQEDQKSYSTQERLAWHGSAKRNVLSFDNISPLFLTHSFTF